MSWKDFKPGMRVRLLPKSNYQILDFDAPPMSRGEEYTIYSIRVGDVFRDQPSVWKLTFKEGGHFYHANAFEAI